MQEIGGTRGTAVRTASGMQAEFGGNREWLRGRGPSVFVVKSFPLPARAPGFGVALAVTPAATGMAPPPTPMPWPGQVPAESAPAAAAGGPTAAAPVVF